MMHEQRPPRSLMMILLAACISSAALPSCAASQRPAAGTADYKTASFSGIVIYDVGAFLGMIQVIALKYGLTCEPFQQKEGYMACGEDGLRLTARVETGNERASVEVVEEGQGPETRRYQYLTSELSQLLDRERVP